MRLPFEVLVTQRPSFEEITTMKRIFLILMTLAVVSFFTACGDSAANTASKPANSAASNSNTPPPVNPAAIEAEIKKLVADYAASTAKNDFAAYEKATTDNFMFVGLDGSVQTKAERVESMKSGATKYDTLTYDDVSVRVNAEGNGAVVIAKVAVKGMNMGKPIDSTVRVTQVWSKTKDGWKMASLQATPITAKADDKAKAEDKLKADDKAKTDDKSADKAKTDDKSSDKAPAPAANKK